MSKIRSLSSGVFAFAVGLAWMSAAQAQGVVRVEPRPFYGAVVTMESGVRVFRPLPADRYIVINPGHATPLSLGIQDTRVYERRTIHNYNHGSSDGDGGNSYSYSGGAFVPGYGGGYRGGYRGGYHRGGYKGRHHGGGVGVVRRGRGHH